MSDGACPQHNQMLRDLIETSTEVKEIKRVQIEHGKSLSEHSAEISKIRGMYEGAVPTMVEDMRRLSKSQEADQETANLYYAQVRDMAGEQESINERLGKIATDDTIDALKRQMISKEVHENSIRNIMLFVKLGWVAITIAILSQILRWVFQ